MERPQWFGAALARGRGGVAQLRGLPGRLFGGGGTDGPGEAAGEKPKAAKGKPAAADAEGKKSKAAPETAEDAAGSGGSWPGLIRGVRERPTLAVAAVSMALLVVAWIAWAIHIGSANGGSAAVGVLITWPLFFLIVANLVLLGIGLTMLFRYLQPADGAAPGSTAPPEGEGKASDEKDADREEPDETDEPDAAEDRGKDTADQEDDAEKASS